MLNKDKFSQIVSFIPAPYVGIIMFYLKFSGENYSELVVEVDKTVREVGIINALAEGPNPNIKQLNLGILEIIDYALVKVGQPRTRKNRIDSAKLLFRNRVVNYLENFELWFTTEYSEKDPKVIEEINGYISNTTQQIIREQEFIKY